MTLPWIGEVTSPWIAALLLAAFLCGPPFLLMASRWADKLPASPRRYWTSLAVYSVVCVVALALVSDRLIVASRQTSHSTADLITIAWMSSWAMIGIFGVARNAAALRAELRTIRGRPSVQ